MPSVSIPDQWRENYPYYKGNPKHLRSAAVFIVIMALLTFGLSCGYYYEYDKDEISKIAFDVETDDDWECESIGVFNGQVSLLNKGAITSNLSTQTKIAFMDLESSGRPSIVNTSIGNYTFNAYQFQTQTSQMEAQQDRTTFEISKGNSPSSVDCLDTFEKGSCSAQSINKSQMISVNVYKFTYTISIDHRFNFTSGDSYENHIEFDLLRLFRKGSDEDIFGDSSAGIITYNELLFSPFGPNEYWFATDSETSDLCSRIESGITNNEIEWGINLIWEKAIKTNNDYYFYPWDTINAIPIEPNNMFYPNITNIDLNVECERISLDYCIVNATNQFTFANVGDLPRGSTMSISNVGEQQFLLLSSELGAACAERWEYVCNEYYDIDGLCTEIVLAPYSCTLIQRKTFLGIVSLAFASSQLVNTILIVIFGFIFSKISKSTWDNDRPPWQQDTVQQMEKQMELVPPQKELKDEKENEGKKEENAEDVALVATETVINTAADENDTEET